MRRILEYLKGWWRHNIVAGDATSARLDWIDQDIHRREILHSDASGYLKQLAECGEGRQ